VEHYESSTVGHGSPAAGGARGGRNGDLRPRDAELRWASITKLATGLALLVASRGTVSPTSRRPRGRRWPLLAHASGYARRGVAVMLQETADLLELRHRARRCAVPSARNGFADYFNAAVVEPLALTARCTGRGMGLIAERSTIAEARKRVAAPTIVAAETPAKRRACIPWPPALLPASGAWSRTTGGSPSSCVTRSRRIGPVAHPVHVRPLRRGGTSPGRSESGSACAVLTDKEIRALGVEAWPSQRFSRAKERP